MEDNFDSCLYAFEGEIKRILSFINPEIKAKIQEIRIRVSKPLTVTIIGKPYYVCKDSSVKDQINDECYICSKSDIDRTYILITKRSVYAHTKELSKGYIRMDFGHRAGICGDFSDSGIINNVSSINIRIARQIIGCATEIYNHLGEKGMLIAGPPGSGKTTVLRDLIRICSYDGYKIALIDSRGEISATSYGKAYNDLGPNTDVLLHQNRGEAIEIALRTLFPDIICFDEIGNSTELNAVLECFNAGTKIITTAHIGNAEELKKRIVTKELLNLGVIDKVILMNKDILKQPEILSIGDLNISDT